MTLLEKHYFYEEQINTFYKRRDEDPKYINMTIDACEKQIEIAKDIAKIMTAGKKRYTMFSDKEILSRFKEESKADKDIIKNTKEGREWQSSILSMIEEAENAPIIVRIKK